jgi:homocitrate synthase NifV
LLALYGIDLGMKYDQLTELARLTVDLTGHKLPQNKSIVGEQVFDIESGIIASWSELCTGALATEVFPLDWRAVGHQSPKVVLGKGSGRANVKHWLERIGMKASPEQTDQLVALVKEQALDKKALVTEDEFRRLVDQVCRS